MTAGRYFERARSTLELDTWANRRDAEARLPELLRLLIRATIPRISRLHLPSGEGVRQRGPDGLLVAEDSNEYVPALEAGVLDDWAAISSHKPA